jgi:hypothetical protein
VHIPNSRPASILGPSDYPKATRRKTRLRDRRLELELLEVRCLLSTTVLYRPIDEVGNNVANPSWGTAGVDLLRLTPAYYANGINSPSLPQDASARVVSNILNNQAAPGDPSADLSILNQQSLTDFVYAFGQFMDHDLDLTLGNGAQIPIPVPPGDPIGGPNDIPLAFALSNVDPLTGTSKGNPAQQITSITSYLDLSQVYGSDLATDNALRTLSGGQMKTSAGGLPPLDNTDYFTPDQLAAINASVGGMADQGPAPQTSMFVTGDTRGNENVELTALQALFLDNHNRLAAALQQEHPHWTDEQLFQEARKINIAQYQEIIYNEWVPDVLGPNALPAYAGYNPTVNPTVSNDFATVAFRFGHSLLDGNIGRQGNDGQDVAASIPLEQDFFDPYVLNGQGQPSSIDPYTGLPSTDIGAILKSDADGISQAEDLKVINEVRNELFNEVIPGVGYGQDLIALDIERGRVNGIGSYNQVRKALGLPAVTNFAQITSNFQVQKELKAAYGNVNNIDPMEGGLAEDPVPGSDVGPLFQTIMVDQFQSLRDGDRYFYLNESWNSDELKFLNQGNTLAKVIEANTNITNLQGDVFVFQASISGTVYLNLNGAYVKNPSGSQGLEGFTVLLENADGNVVATTTTNGKGQYTFNQLSGPAADPTQDSGVSGTGSYQVVLVVPPWFRQTTPNPGAVQITRGGMNVSGVNFGVGFLDFDWIGGRSRGTNSYPGANPSVVVTGSNSLIANALSSLAPAVSRATVTAPPADSAAPVTRVTVGAAVVTSSTTAGAGQLPAGTPVTDSGAGSGDVLGGSTGDVLANPTAESPLRSR